MICMMEPGTDDDQDLAGLHLTGSHTQIMVGTKTFGLS